MTATRRGYPPKMRFKRLRRVLCGWRGHRVFRGERGWENFGTGWYCRTCNCMTVPPQYSHPSPDRVVPHPPVYDGVTW